MEYAESIIYVSTCAGFAVFGIVAILATLIGLPGIWAMILGSLVLKIWHPEWFSWWTIVVVLVLALIAEAIEFAAGAAGSRYMGGSKRAGVCAIVGGVIGAISGSMFPPVIGAIIWGVVGAGVGAILGELWAGRKWKESFGVGGAAATSKLIGTITKTGIALVVFVILFGALIIS